MQSFSLLKPYFKENRHLIFLGLVCLIVVDFLQLFIPRIIKWTIDDLTAGSADPAALMRYALYIIAIAVIMGIFRYLWRHCLIGTSRRVEEGLRNELFSHLQTLSASYFAKAKTGDLMAHATNDIQNIRMATGMGLVALTDAIVLGIAAIGFMAYINITLTILVLLPMPLIVLGTRFFGKKLYARYQGVQASFSNLTEAVRERFAGIRIIKAFGMEKEEAAFIETVSEDYIKKNILLVKIIGSFFPMMLFLANSSLAALLYFGGRKTIVGLITAGDFVAFISYLGLLTWPMMAIGWVTNLIHRGRASLDRINKILETKPAISDSECNKSSVKHELLTKTDLRFEKVSFFYNHDNKNTPVLSNIDIKLKHGTALGIVGPPGSGKTTLASLIPRLFDVTSGNISIAGHNIRNMLLSDLRQQISFMPQEPFLFSGTILDNILLGKKNIKNADLIKAVKRACLHDTINSFKNGFETIVGEKGVMLSGGQKQRIALARAFLKNRSILILDDPISQVDMETGNSIINSIKSMSKDMLVIIVSHRLSALSFADNIIVLDNGRITEIGSHFALMEKNGYYAKTYHLQEVTEDINAN